MGVLLLLWEKGGEGETKVFNQICYLNPLVSERTRRGVKERKE